MHLRLLAILTCVNLIALPWLSDVSFAQERKRAELNVKERKIQKFNNKAVAPDSNKSAVFVVEVERKLLRGIDKTIRYLKKTAGSLPKKSPQRLQVQERILNLYVEQATYQRSEEERRYDTAWKRWAASGKKGTEPRINTRRSEGNWKSVITQSSIILKEYPKAKNADEITYNQAVALQYLGQEKDAARIYNKLIKQYPNSPIIGDAYTSLGDFYFDRDDFRNAKKNFLKALRYKKSKRYLWAMFKLGWCSYNLGDYKKSLVYWKRVVSISKKSGKKGIQLREDALRDMVFAFAELKQIDAAIRYYRSNKGSEYIGPFLVLLAQILSDQGEYLQAIKVHKRFQKVVPFDEGAPSSQKEIISLYAAQGRYKDVWKELAAFNALYGVKSKWASRQKPEVVKETSELIKDQLLYYPSLTHQKAIADDNKRLNIEARNGYLLFLKAFPNAIEAPSILYYLGDIEYYLKDYQSAGRYYLQIASMGKEKAIRINPKTNKKINMHREVSIFMVNSFVKDFEPEFNVLKKRKPDFSKPKPLSNRAKNYIKACDLYTKWYPQDGTRVRSCDVGVANIFYYSGYRKESIGRLQTLALKYPASKEGAASVDLLIPLFKDDRVQLVKAANRFLRVPQYRRGEMGKKLRALQRGAEKELIAKESDILKRAQKYEAQARKYPRDPEADKLWYNAAVDYVKAGAIPNAVAAYLVLVKRFPKTPQAKESLIQVAQIYERQLDFENASGFYLQYTKQYPKEKETPGALAKSCELQIALNTSRSLTICSSFAERYPDGAKGYIEELIKGAERAKRFGQMAQIINTRYINKFKLTPNEKIVAFYRIYSATNGSGPAAVGAARQIKATFEGAGGSVSGEALRYVGELYYKEAAPIVPRYAAISLKGGTVDNLLASIQQKSAALAQLEASFNRVVSTKDAYWGVAALYQLGAANEQFAEQLANPPAIQGASQQDVLAQLKPQIDQFKKQSYGWYKTAQDTVGKFKVYNDYSVKVLNGLARVSNSQIQFADYVIAPDFLGAEVDAAYAAELQ